MAAPPQKRTKSSAGKTLQQRAPRDDLFDSVTKGMKSVDTLHPSTREMLSKMAKFALSMKSDKRNPHQDAVIDMIRAVFRDWEASLEKDVRELVQEGDVVGARMDSAEEALPLRKEELQASQEKVNDSKKELTRAIVNLKNSKKAVQRMEKEQSKAALQLQKAKGAKDDMAEILARSQNKAVDDNGDALPPLLKGAAAALVRSLSEAGISGTLLVALPSALSKGPERRTKFDVLVLDELEREMARIAEKRDAKLKDQEANLVSKEGASAEAVASVEEAQVERGTCVEALSNAKEELAQSQMALKDAKLEVLAAKADVADNEKVLEKAQHRLEAFSDGAKADFDSLRAMRPLHEYLSQKEGGDASTAGITLFLK